MVKGIRIVLLKIAFAPMTTWKIVMIVMTTMDSHGQRRVLKSVMEQTTIMMEVGKMEPIKLMKELL